MKKKILIAALALCAGTIAAQDARFTIGSKFGFGHSWMMPYSNNAFYPSWQAGLATAYQFGEHLAFGADALYSSEGVKFVSGDATATEDIDYLRVPLRLMYVMGSDGASFRPRAYVGPTFGVLFAEGTGYRDMDFGANLGLGFSYKLYEDFWITLDGDYYHGLMDIYKGNSEKERNGNIRLNLGLVFGI
jgi:hypothetical protein